MSDILRRRVQALEHLFEHIERTRMLGVPLLNPALRVEAIGFAPHTSDDDEPGAVGVLVTPWFMNLLWMPLAARDHPSDGAGTRLRGIGDEVFEFIRAHEAPFGAFEACSLFSPMSGFADHAAARATAEAVLASLRAPAPGPMRPARRAILFGRGAVEGRQR